MPPATTSSKYAVRPIQRFAESAAQCTKEGSVYGACIMVDYNNVFIDKCGAEFAALKACFMAHAKKGR